MTREEKLYSMRGKDLVQYCIDHGIKVHQTRGILKEPIKNVVNRILAVEAGAPRPEWQDEVDGMVEEFKALLKKNPNGDATKYGERLLELGGDAILYFAEQVT